MQAMQLYILSVHTVQSKLFSSYEPSIQISYQFLFALTYNVGFLITTEN